MCRRICSEAYHEVEARLRKQRLPGGNADEILREMSYLLGDRESRILLSRNFPF